MIKRFVLTVFLILTSISVSDAQNLNDFVRPFFGFYDSQSLQTAIGNAGTAAGQIIPGRSNNPANLGLSRFYHTQMNFQSNSFNGNNIEQTYTRFGGLYAVMPVQVYQGSLVFGAGIQKLTDFSNAYVSKNTIDNVLHTTEGIEEGGIYATEVAFSMEIAENLFIGGAYNFLGGSNTVNTTYYPDNHNVLLNPKYSGQIFTFGFLHRTTPILQLGGSVQGFSKLKVREKLVEWNSDSPHTSETSHYNYYLSRPIVLNLGANVLLQRFSLLYSMEWNDWSEMVFSSNTYFDGDIAQYNNDISRNLQSTLAHRFGTAIHLPWLPMHLYGGYQFLPTPHKNVYDNDRRDALSSGFSYLMSQNFSIHSSWSHYFWKYMGMKESYDMFIFGATLHY